MDYRNLARKSHLEELDSRRLGGAAFIGHTVKVLIGTLNQRLVRRSAMRVVEVLNSLHRAGGQSKDGTVVVASSNRGRAVETAIAR